MLKGISHGKFEPFVVDQTIYFDPTSLLGSDTLGRNGLGIIALCCRYPWMSSQIFTDD